MNTEFGSNSESIIDVFSGRAYKSDPDIALLSSNDDEYMLTVVFVSQKIAPPSLSAILRRKVLWLRKMCPADATKRQPPRAVVA
jgi:hypothetical protein